MPSSQRPRILVLPLLLAACAEPVETSGAPVAEVADAAADASADIVPRTVEAGAARPADELEPAPIEPAFKPVVIDQPCGKGGARYGTAVALGDLDGDGELELVVGADGEGAVYVHRRKGSSFALAGAYQATGPGSCPLLDQPGGFGAALALGDLDGISGDEIAVGAPLAAGPDPNVGLVHLIGHSSNPTQEIGALPVTALVPDPRARGLFGKSLVVGDFDGDGTGDLAVGAPTALVAGKTAGVVAVYFGPVSAESQPLLLANPAPVDNGNFGHALAASDWDGDGDDDLAVSAVGNTVGGAELAGQVVLFTSPLDPREFLSVEDPVPVADDLPRFGMHVALRGNLLAVGSPRKDWRGVEDAGLGVLFQGRALDSELFPHPQPFPDAILGFRVVLADVVGDSRLDLAVATLPKKIGAVATGPRRPAEPSRPSESGGQARSAPAGAANGAAGDSRGPGGPAKPNRGFWVWDGAEPGPPLQLLAAPGSADHFPQGVAAGQLWPGGREELVLGDNSWDRKGAGKKDNTGRVVVYRLK